MEQAVIENYPNAYATYGIELFTNKKLWRVEDGFGKQLSSNEKSELVAWRKAYKNIIKSKKNV